MEGRERRWRGGDEEEGNVCRNFKYDFGYMHTLLLLVKQYSIQGPIQQQVRRKACHWKANNEDVAKVGSQMCVCVRVCVYMCTCVSM